MSGKHVMLKELPLDYVKTSRQHTDHCSKTMKCTLLQDVLPAAAFSRSAMLCGRPDRVNTYKTVFTK